MIYFIGGMSMYDVKVNYSKQFVADVHKLYEGNAKILALVDGGDFALGEAILREASERKKELSSDENKERAVLFADWSGEANDTARAVFEKPAKKPLTEKDWFK